MRRFLLAALTPALFASASFARTPERTGQTTMGGKPVVLLGTPVNVGDAAPDFTAVDAAWKPTRLSDLKGKVVILSSVPSLDTRVCSIQTRRFNKEAQALGKNIQIVTLSEDLPFAQKRFCSAEKIGSILVLSDTVDREYGLKYGLLIKGRSLLARAVIVVGKDGKVVYEEIVPDLSREPDYAKALAAAKTAAAAP
ncbi:MAG TPA: thiol peroxidase [Elusimicrobiota bacterium]|jgi:thiol peroxidase|nr:thiol peroxidase [Elusimicrobiota bacterium]